MPAQQQQHDSAAFPFVVEDDQGRLAPLVLSHLAIGQFELARGLLFLPPPFYDFYFFFAHQAHSRVCCAQQLR